MVLCVTAQETDATDATLVRMRLDVFDLYAERRGAHTDADKARLIKVNRSTMWRYRYGKQQPSLDKAAKIAAVLGIPLETLIETGAAA